MTGQPQPTSEPNSAADAEAIGREDLVAYLDGELDADAARRIEERLRTDETLRDELHRLDRAWNVLSTLPHAEADASLTKSTVEILALETEDDFGRGATRRRRQRLAAWATAAAMLFAAGLMGTLLAGAAWPDPDAPLLRDLPVVEQLDAYQQAGSVEFLQSLRERGLFVQDTSHDRADAR
jgi:anti-sigma factor RsiW